MPRLDRSGRGDLHIVISVEVPIKLSKRAKELVIELEEELQSSEARKASRA
jgi:DnaJ-class molecular chaperone